MADPDGNLPTDAERRRYKARKATEWVAMGGARVAGRGWRAAKRDASDTGRAGAWAAASFGDWVGARFAKHRTADAEDTMQTAADAPPEAPVAPQPPRPPRSAASGPVIDPAPRYQAPTLAAARTPRPAPQAQPFGPKLGPMTPPAPTPRPLPTATNVQPTQRERHHKMSQYHPVVAGASESVASLGSHQFRNYNDIKSMVNATPAMFANFAGAFAALADQLEGTPAGADTAANYRNMAAQLQSMSHGAETNAAMFAASHVEDDKRLSSPRPNEGMADYSANLD
ncbi:hypothetical protein [Glycomyces paridis]|uniref:Uncharacterized protein n=1 Tax=Glycomyces paridis TaxID=2126555 RepID=A0A4S8PMX4_9ACTN|nr:hypothetical protein [Glycomyces paridis]THV29644.1 hypothetical protein E9998_09175 [Glycomyces paridis]